MNGPGQLSAWREEAASLLNAAQHPVILAGVELVRFGLAESVLRLVEHVELPFATTVSSKSVLPELHPQFVGLYQGALSRERVRVAFGFHCLGAIESHVCGVAQMSLAEDNHVSEQLCTNGCNPALRYLVLPRRSRPVGFVAGGSA